MIRSLRWARAIAVVVALLLTATITPLHAQADSTSAPPDDTTLVAPTDRMPAVDVGDQVVGVPLPLVFQALRTKATDCLSSGGLPDAACTPGAVDPRVSQDNISSTICTTGYTAKERPSTSVTNRIKVQQMAAYNLQDQPLSTFELDHLISLELGGAPADVANLWPEPWTGDDNARQKDAVETQLKREVCIGTLALVDAQRMIATDWVAVYRDRGLQPAP